MIAALIGCIAVTWAVIAIIVHVGLSKLALWIVFEFLMAVMFIRYVSERAWFGAACYLASVVMGGIVCLRLMV